MKGIERRPKFKFSSGSEEMKHSRSLSPNNVVIDGQIIDKERPAKIAEFKKMPLENIVEETDPVLPDLDFGLEDRKNSAPLEEAVKAADENVQKFIKELSENKTDTNSEPMRKRSEEELKELTKLLSIIDANSKSKIVDTLISVYKKEIINCINNISDPNVSSGQFSKTLNSNYQYKAKNPETKQVRFSDTRPSVIVQESQSLVEFNSQTEQESIDLASYDCKAVLTSSNLSLNEDVPKTKKIKRQAHGEIGYLIPNDYKPKQTTGKKQKEHNVEKKLISEGIQANVPLRKKTRTQGKSHTFEYLNNFESRSDIETDRGLGCQVKLNRSKSDTALNQLKQRKKKQRKQKDNKKNKAKKSPEVTNLKKSSNGMQVSKKPSMEQPEIIQLRKNQLINYLDHELRTGNSSDQFSQVLFETANKLIENDLSSMEIPYGEPVQFGSFDPNYLLHTLKIASQSKTDVLPRIPLEYFPTSGSDVSVSEEEYKKWLRQRNWTKYSFPYNTLPSVDNLYSISQAISGEPLGEYGYFLDKENVPPRPSAFEDNSFLGDFAETFLYEQVVISKAMNFFLTFNAKRTRVLSKKDRCFQVLFLVLFYSIWVFMDTVFIDSKNKKGLWK